MSRQQNYTDDPSAYSYDDTGYDGYDDDDGQQQYDNGTQGYDDGTYGDYDNQTYNTTGTGYDDTGTYNTGSGYDDTGTYDDGTGASSSFRTGSGTYDDSADNPEGTYDDNYDDTTGEGSSHSMPDSYRSGRPESSTDRGASQMPAEQYDDEYDPEDEEEENDQEYYDRGNAYNNNYEYRTDEAEEEHMIKKQEKRDERDSNLGKRVVAAVCCCCICIITIIILILLLVVFKEEDAKSSSGGGSRTGNAPTTPKPTPRPTYPVPPALKPHNMNRPDVFTPWIRETDAPTVSPRPTAVASDHPTIRPTRTPTPKPTISPAPTRKLQPFIEVPADADTYIFVDGFFQYEAYGNEDSFLVQNGLAEYYEFADAVGLISFDMSDLPKAAQVSGLNPKVMLRLEHLEVAPQFAGRGSSVLQVRKLVSTPMRVDTIHGGMLNKEPEGSVLGENTFTVAEAAGSVKVDISDLLYPADFAGYDRNQFFLMVINNSTEQGDPEWTEKQFADQAGDRFKSVETGSGPVLEITYL